MASRAGGIDRRAALALLPIGLAAPGAWAATPLPGVAPDTRTWLRLNADPAGRPVFAVERGMVWGFLPQADGLQAAQFARRLYGYAGLTVRRLRISPDGAALWSRSWHVYTDVATGEAIEKLRNPYTDVMVDVPSFASPAATVRYAGAARLVETAAEPVALETRRIGDHAWMQRVQLSRFRTPDIDWFKLEADMVTFACRARDLDDPGGDFLNPTWSHNLVAEWQTWMRMHGTPGHILFRGEGAFVDGPAAVPAPLSRAIERLSPGALGRVTSEAEAG